MIITSREGQVIRTAADGVRVTGRVSQGVKVITLREGDSVQDATALPSVEDLEQDAVASQESFQEAVDSSSSEIVAQEDSETTAEE